MPGTRPGMTELFEHPALQRRFDHLHKPHASPRDSIAEHQTASFFAAVPKATSANAAVDACGIPDGFSGAGAIISVSCLESSQDRLAQA